MVTAEYAPLRDEGEAYAERLAEARTHRGRPVRRVIHGFFTLGPVSEAAQTVIDESLELFAKLLAGG